MFSGCGVGVEPRTPQNLIRIGLLNEGPPACVFPYLAITAGHRQLLEWFTWQTDRPLLVARVGRFPSSLPYNEARSVASGGAHSSHGVPRIQRIFRSVAIGDFSARRQVGKRRFAYTGFGVPGHCREGALRVSSRIRRAWRADRPLHISRRAAVYAAEGARPRNRD